MKTITVYECPYCKKLFRTPDKHNCKRDPEKKNCFSCSHLQRFADDCQQATYDEPGYRNCNPVCWYSEHYERETEDIIDFMYHKNPRWSLDCPSWEGKD